MNNKEIEIMDQEANALYEEMEILRGIINKKRKQMIYIRAKALKERMENQRKIALINAKHTTKTDEIW